MDNHYVDVAFAVLKRECNAEPYAPAVAELAQKLRPILDRLGMMERAELVAWLCTPVAELDGSKPVEVIFEGQPGRVLDLLQRPTA